MEYKDKYMKYKTKYLGLKGTQIGGKKDNKKNNNKFDKIIDFINKSNKEEIAEKILDLIENKEFCPTKLGEGFGGKVYTPAINKTFPYNIGNKIIEIPIVVKEETQQFNETFFGLNILDNILYINGYSGVTAEALILMYINKLREKTVHLPLLLDYGTCSKHRTIDRIYTQKYGLNEHIEIDMAGKIYDEAPLWHKQDKKK